MHWVRNSIAATTLALAFAPTIAHAQKLPATCEQAAEESRRLELAPGRPGQHLPFAGITRWTPSGAGGDCTVVAFYRLVEQPRTATQSVEEIVRSLQGPRVATTQRFIARMVTSGANGSQSVWADQKTCSVLAVQMTDMQVALAPRFASGEKPPAESAAGDPAYRVWLGASVARSEDVLHGLKVNYQGFGNDAAGLWAEHTISVLATCPLGEKPAIP